MERAVRRHARGHRSGCARRSSRVEWRRHGARAHGGPDAGRRRRGHRDAGPARAGADGERGPRRRGDRRRANGHASRGRTCASCAAPARTAATASWWRATCAPGRAGACSLAAPRAQDHRRRGGVRCGSARARRGRRRRSTSETAASTWRARADAARRSSSTRSSATGLRSQVAACRRPPSRHERDGRPARRRRHSVGPRRRHRRGPRLPSFRPT